jgi:hypothetical protein
MQMQRWLQDKTISWLSTRTSGAGTEEKKEQDV